LGGVAVVRNDAEVGAGLTLIMYSNPGCGTLYRLRKPNAGLSRSKNDRLRSNEAAAWPLGDTRSNKDG
jgi:hypothetical protein